ncbi:MAG: hypothetical protein QOC88_1758, partial [Mycobacterium sp.]|nr:hypothetical protein [Mycobacterium sp.]
FRPLPAKLWISSVAVDDEDAEHPEVRLVCGRWPTDGQPWKLSNDDAMLYVDSGELQLFMEPDSVSGDGPAISVATADNGRRYLKVETEDSGKLQRLPRSCGQDNATDGK